MIESLSQTSSPEKGLDIERQEQSFLLKLSNLPEEMAQKWKDRFDDIYPEDERAFFDEFDSFLAMRNKALGVSMEIEDNLSEEIIAECLKTNEVIQKTFGDPHYFLGNGFTAEVYTIPVAPHICVKYVADQEAYNSGNHMRKEEGFLRDLRSHSFEGIRTPTPYFLRIHPGEGHSYGMERIDGKSLSQILERPAENIELLKLVKEMDKKAVLARFTAYIKSLHDQFKLTHGDLFLRNLMMDNEGNFYVIDFGKSEVEEIGQDHEMRRNSDMAIIRSEINTFFNKVDNIDISDIIESSKDPNKEIV